MQASASAHEAAPPGVSAPARTAVRRDDGRLFPVLFPTLFFGGVLAVYVGIGYVLYALIVA